jgi:general secretion pathway protein D
VVLRDASRSDDISLDRYDLMRGKQQQAQPVPSSVLSINESAVMPAVAPRPPAQATPAQAQPAPAPQPPVARPLPPATDRQ